jgi:Uma2 family endonuclease
MGNQLSSDERMSVDSFFARYKGSIAGQYELVDGEVIEMSPERVRHVPAKGAALIALQNAVERSGLNCTVFNDGTSVQIDQYTVRVPDVAVQCGNLDNLDAMDPLIVVEVVSPSIERDDSGRKVVEYFSVPTVQHYIANDPWKRVVLHYARGTGDRLETRLTGQGELDLTPPGLKVAVEQLLGPA